MCVCVCMYFTLAKKTRFDAVGEGDWEFGVVGRFIFHYVCITVPILKWLKIVN